MSENEIDLIALAKTLWSQKRLITIYACVGIAIGVIISLSIPKEYTSTLKVAPEGQSKMSAGSLGALAGMMGANVTGGNMDAVSDKLYPEIIASTPFTLEFADIPVEYDDTTMPLSEYMLKNQKKTWWSYIFGFPGRAIGWVASIGQDKVDTLTIKNSPAIQYSFASALSNALKSETDAKMGTLTFTCTFQDPIIAKTVSDSLIIKLQKYMTHYRTAKTRSTLESNMKMLEEAKNKFFELDELYAQTADRNQNLISKSASIKLDRLSDERSLSFQVYQQLALQVETDKVKLQEEKPIVTIIEPPTTPIHPSAPRKMIIIAAFTFLCGAFAVGKIIIHEVFNTKKNGNAI